MLIACEDKKMELEQGMTVEQCLIKLGVSREGVLAVQQGGRVLNIYAVSRQMGATR
ncbi:unknown [Faecalibacterium sp. CAG:74]|nr:unknown [Faecalibacterium sp. CAG:74]